MTNINIPPSTPKAKSITVGGCGDPLCNCGQVTIALFDRAGRVFATASMDPEGAHAFALEIMAAAETMKRATNERP